jgi:hypothetical protein
MRLEMENMGASVSSVYCFGCETNLPYRHRLSHGRNICVTSRWARCRAGSLRSRAGLRDRLRAFGSLGGFGGVRAGEFRRSRIRTSNFQSLGLSLRSRAGLRDRLRALAALGCSCWGILGFENSNVQFPIPRVVPALTRRATIDPSRALAAFARHVLGNLRTSNFQLPTSNFQLRTSKFQSLTSRTADARF